MDRSVVCTSHLSSFAAESSLQFSAEALAAARSRPKFVEGLEASLAALLAGDKRRESLAPMPKPDRALVHELAKVYGIATASYDDGPRRHVDLFRTANGFLPGVRLSDAAKASPEASAAAAAAAAAAAFEIQLVDVECSKAALDTTLRQLAGEYSVQHSGRPADGSPMRVSLLFEYEKAARLALEILGGGVRGSFRVILPAWLAKGRQQPPPMAGAGGARHGGGFGGGFGGSFGPGGGGGGVSGGAGGDRWGALRGGSAVEDAPKGAADDFWDDDDDDDGGGDDKGEEAAATASAAAASAAAAKASAAAAAAAAAAASAASMPTTGPSELEEPDAWDDDED